MFDSPASAFAAMKAGKVDVVIADIDPAKAVIKGEPDYDISELLTVEEYAVAIKKGQPELLAAVSLCKSGKISRCCTPNALMTLKEYLMDYASPATRAEGERMIAKSLTDIPEGRIREITIERLKRIENGEHDFRF